MSMISFYNLLEAILLFLKKTVAVSKKERYCAAYLDDFLDCFVN